MERTQCRQVTVAVWLMLAVSMAASGQQVRRSEIAGTIRDATGGALPGVTVTVTSPALQVPSVVRISDERGGYQVPDLPTGTFRVTYELSGFATLVREEIVLTAGFAARMDVDMKVAELAETITVSGQSPVVDVTTTRGGATVSKELIAAIPGNQNFRDVMIMVGGMRTTTPPYTAGLTAAAVGFAGRSYGVGSGARVTEGMKQLNQMPVNFSAYEEVEVKTFGNTADVDQAGAAVQMIVKSGSNAFHGRYNDIFQHKAFQATNLDDELRADGLSTGDTVEWFNDFTGDIGGRIIRNKLWFYGNVRRADNKYTSAGFVAGPGQDGVYQTGDEPVAYPTDYVRSGVFKISYQATAKHRFIGVYHQTSNRYFQYFSRYVPLESSARLTQVSRDMKPFEWQGALNNRLLLNMMYGVAWFTAYRQWNGPLGAVSPTGGWVAGSGEPSRFDRTTLQQTGPAWDVNVLATSDNPQHQLRGSMNYVPENTWLGSHAFQAGYLLGFSTAYRTFPGGIEGDCKPGRKICPANAGIGEYRLTYDAVGGLPHQGAEMDVKNFPVTGYVKKNWGALYLMDSWRPTTRLTLNLGVRWERKANEVPAGSKVPTIPAGFVEPVGDAFSNPKTDAGTWNVWAPRAGAAYDLSGDGKTVLKGTYGWFNEDLLPDYGSAFSQNFPVTYTYRWHDLNRDGNYQPGEVNLSTSGPDFLSVAGVSSNRVNPNLRLPHTHEMTGSLERQLGQGLAIRGLYVYKRVVDNFGAVNVLRPYSVYDQVFTRQDPGPDGVLGGADDGPLYTIYDYNPAYRGAAFVANENTNEEPSRHDAFQSVEVMLTKRASGRWFGNTSMLSTKNHVWRTRTLQSPNDSIFPVADYWDLMYVLAGGYNFPRGFSVSSLYQLYNGFPRQRTVQFRAVDPAGGPRFPSSSTITLPMEELGATRGPTRQIMNLRFGKATRFRQDNTVTVSVDAFNAFNTNVPWDRDAAGINDVSGPTYGNITAFVGPRTLRFNVGFEF